MSLYIKTIEIICFGGGGQVAVVGVPLHMSFSAGVVLVVVVMLQQFPSLLC